MVKITELKQCKDMAKDKLKYIYISIIILFIGWLYYTTNTLKQYSDNLDKVIQQTKVASSDSLTTDTAKINYINTDINDENKSTEKRKGNQ